jgi:hypothetical protein
MKKSNQANILVFQKAAFAELNQSLMNEINEVILRETESELLQP